MKKLILITLLIVAISPVFAQKKHIIKKSITITTDSVIYEPDTIAVYFKELIITDNNISEKWNNGFVIWETWTKFEGFTTMGIWSGGVISESRNGVYKNEYKGDRPQSGIFLYSDKSQVKNIVLNSIKR